MAKIKTSDKAMRIEVQEEADISSVDLQPDHVKVGGYQNFDIYRNKIECPVADSHKWTDTDLKTSLIRKIIIKEKCRSYLDFGSNLGVLVFAAAQLYIESTGVDYNKDYIKVCNAITNYMNFTKANFLTASFDYLKKAEGAALISLMNIHHHLYGRTDRPLSLKEINQSVLAKCKWMITQFPTEIDAKAAKWTGLYPGLGEYSLGAFIESLEGQDFVVLFESDTRPILLVRGLR